MKKKYVSINIPYWKILHFEAGKKIGESRHTCFKGLVHYNRRGRIIGKSIRNIFGELHHYDDKGQCTGYSRHSSFGIITHFNSRGRTERITHNIIGILFIHSRTAVE